VALNIPALDQLARRTIMWELITKRILFLATLTFSITAAAQDRIPQAQQILDAMSANVEVIRTRVQDDRAASNLCNDLRDLISTLKMTHAHLTANRSDEVFTATEGRIANTSNAPRREDRRTEITNTYIASLQSDNDLLASILKRQTTADDLRQALNDVKDDLEIKYKFMSAGKFIEEKHVYTAVGSARNPRVVYTRRAGEILVTAQTLNNSQDVPGYRVFFVPQGWAKDPGHYREFSSLSPTREEEISPGPYFIWSVKGSTITDRSLVRIGAQGPHQVLQIAVPSN
jgi:hypothetical protein